MAAAVINTTINYHLPGTAVRYPGTAQNYLHKDVPHKVQISDMRNTKPRLDEKGFELHHHTSSEKDFFDEDAVKSTVYNETIELLKAKTGATRVKPFSHIIRRQLWEDAFNEAGNKKGTDAIKYVVPARFVHVDQSYKGATQIFEDNLNDEEAQKLSKTRWGIINVWRPIHNTVSRDPLAVCDARTVRDEDLVGVTAKLPPKGSGTFEEVSQGKGFETWELVGKPEHKWYYASNMTPEECLFIKCYDSKKDGRARRSPHTAFINPATADEPQPRESIEVRCLVFWENEAAE